MAPRLQKSLAGRLFGLSEDKYAYAQHGWQDNVEEASSGSTGTDLEPHGHTRITADAADNFRLKAPIPGVRKSIAVESTGTDNRTVTLISGTFQTTAGSTFDTATFNAQGEGIELVGVTTSLYVVTNNIGSVAFSEA